MAAPLARLDGDTVVVPDEKEANTLYNKGAFGTPQSGGALALDLVEALYLVEHNRLRVEGHDKGDLLRHAASRERDFELRYLVYRDLRGRTYVVKRSGVMDWNVYPRGALPGRAPSKQLVRCSSERGTLDAAALLDEVARATKLQKTLLVALVDEEGDLTYYEATTGDLRSDAPALPKGRAQADLLDDRVAVTDPASAKALQEGGWFGRDAGVALQLSFPEAVYLAENDRLAVRGHDAAGLRAHAREAEPDLDLRLDLYRHLRGAGVVVKTGFKYGTHFRAYTGPPDEEHAPYLVHALPTGRRVAWPEVSGFVRLAHGVRKRLFFAVPAGDGFRLLELKRTRP